MVQVGNTRGLVTLWEVGATEAGCRDRFGATLQTLNGLRKNPVSSLHEGTRRAQTSFGTALPASVGLLFGGDPARPHGSCMKDLDALHWPRCGFSL